MCLRPSPGRPGGPGGPGGPGNAETPPEENCPKAEQNPTLPWQHTDTSRPQGGATALNPGTQTYPLLWLS